MNGAVKAVGAVGAVTTGELAAAVGGRAVGDPATVVSGLAVEPGRVVPGDLYADCEGPVGPVGPDRTNTAVARERGARALVVGPAGPAAGFPAIVVDDVRVAAGRLASLFLGHPARRMSVVAVTGTNGKTTVHWLASKLLGRFGLPCLRLGTLGIEVDGRYREEYPGREGPNSLTLNRTLRQAADMDVAYACIEATSRSLAEHRWSGVDIDVGVFTNFSRDHLDYHGTMEAYYAAKCRLFDVLAESCKPRRTAVVGADDPLLRALAPSVRARGLPLVTFGFAPGADVSIRAHRQHAGGSSFDLVVGGRPFPVTTAAVGAHNARNLAAAFAALLALGFDPADVACGLGRLPLPPGRLERVVVGPGTVDDVQVYVDYAHSPDALATVLAAVRPLTRGRLWVVFGCGGDRDRGKRPLMFGAAAAIADRVVVTSDNPRHEDPRAVIDDILAGRPAYRVEPDRRRAIHETVAALAPGDVLVLAGKGHEREQIVGDTRYELSDVDEARSALALRHSPAGAVPSPT